MTVSMHSERTNIFCDTPWSEIHLPNMYGAFEGDVDEVQIQPKKDSYLLPDFWILLSLLVLVGWLDQLCSYCGGQLDHCYMFYCSVCVRSSITGYLPPIDKGYITPADRRSRNILVLIPQIHPKFNIIKCLKAKS